MALRDAFVNIAKNAAASAASGFVSGVADGLRSGGSPASAKSSALQSSFNAKAKPILMYPAGLGTDGRNLNYIMFTPLTVTGSRLKKNLGGHKKALFAKNNVVTKEQLRAANAQNAADAKTATAAAQKGGGGEPSSVYERNITTTKTQRTIALYMPPQLNVSYGMDYAESEISGASEILYGIFKDYQSTGSFDGTIKDLASGPAPEVLKGMAAKIV